MSEQQEIASVEQFLRELGVGEFHSEGRFSVNSEKALSKLRTHSLADPGLFVVELLAFAVCSKAETFQVQTQSGEVVASFDGQGPKLENYENPASNLLDQNDDPGRIHLSLALLGASELAAGANLQFTSKSGQVLSFQDGHWTLKSAAEQPSLNSLKLSRPYRALAERWKKKPSLEKVMKVGALAPLKLSVNDSWVYNLFHPGPTGEELAGRLLVSGPPKFEKYLKQSAGFLWEESTELNFTAVLFFGDAQKTRQQGLLFLRNGLQYRASSEELGPGVSGIVVSSELKRDLGGAGVVRDAVYREILLELKRLIGRFLGHLVSSELRARAATIELRPLVEQHPGKETEAWLAWVSEHLLEETTQLQGREVQGLLDKSQPDQVESVALLQMEQFLKESHRFSYNYRRVVEQTAQHRWSLSTQATHPRLLDFGGLVSACCYLQDGAWPDYPDTQSPFPALRLRLEGNLSEALELLGERPDKPADLRSLMEIYLEQENYDKVIARCLDVLEAPSITSLTSLVQYQKPVYLFEFIAFSLQLLGKPKEAAHAYQAVLDSSYSHYVNYLRTEVWCGMNRGLLSTAQWLRQRVRTSGRGAWLHVTLNTQKPPSSLHKALKGRFQPTLEDNLTGFFYQTGKIYRDTFDFFVTNIAQALRRSGQFRRANCFAALGELHMEAHRRRETLRNPNASYWY